jgi:hypothetical protein
MDADHRLSARSGRHATRPLAAVAAVLTVLWAAGCATVENKERTILLERSVKVYVTAVRWSDFETAAGFSLRRDGTPHESNLPQIEGVRVVSSEHDVTQAGPESLQAQMTASFRYQRNASATVRRITQTAVWWYDLERGVWFMDAPLPAF